MKQSFVATVGEILPEEASQIPELAGAISYWSEGVCRPEDWLRQVKSSWGPAGYAMRRGGEMLGFVIFGPVEFLPRGGSLSNGLSDENSVLMACVTGERRVKKHLLVRMLKELRQRGATHVQAVASDFGASHHTPRPAFCYRTAGSPYAGSGIPASLTPLYA